MPIFCRFRDIRFIDRKSAFSSHFCPPQCRLMQLQMGSPRTYGMKVGVQKLSHWLPEGENCMILRSLVLSQY